MGRFLSGGASWFEMAVSRNDLPGRTGHQAGMVIPKPGRYLFPRLPDAGGETSCRITVMADGWPVELRYGLYAKDETHLTGGTDDLAKAWLLKPDSVIRFQRGYDGTLAMFPVGEAGPERAEATPDFDLLITDLAELGSENGDFDPSDIEDARRRVARAIALRLGQPKFRESLLEAYQRRCAISGCDEVAALEAAHIHPWRGDESHHVSNGLLLRSDLHTLFDRGLLGVDPADGYRILVSSQIRTRHYRRFEAQPIVLPALVGQRPSPAALEWHLRHVFVA